MNHFKHMEYTEILITAQQLLQQAFNYDLCQLQTIVNHKYFIPAKYLLTDSITQYLQENNPLLHDLIIFSQKRELSIN